MSIDAAHEAAGGADGVTPEVLLGWRASGWLRDEWGRATV